MFSPSVSSPFTFRPGSGSNWLYWSTITCARFLYSSASCFVHQSRSVPTAS